MKHIYFFIFVVEAVLGSSKNFRLGRSKGGNLGAPAGVLDQRLPEARWFTQKLDHFVLSDTRTWKQRYFVNDSFFEYEKPGPVFLMIGGEGPADARWMLRGAWIDYAIKFKALCILLEHRYYGESQPTEDLSVKNLIYLSSRQALSDLANFISAMNEEYNLGEEVRWIAFGGSYPGALAAWLRVRSPHLLHAAVSSSGPLRAEGDFAEYFQVVADALREKTGNNECINEIIEAHRQVDDLIKTKPRIIEDKFRVCQSFEKASPDDMSNFYSSIADNFADLVQYNEDNRFTNDPQYKNVTINSVCAMLTEPGDKRKAYERLATFNSIMLDKSKQECLDYSYGNMITGLRNTSWNSGEGGRQWTYQTCTEFGFYQTSSALLPSQLFGNYFPLHFFIQQCQHIFGNKYNLEFVSRAVNRTNVEYGGLHIAASRVVFVHGSVDPWHALGLTVSRAAIYIRGTAHCANMYPASPHDAPNLRTARSLVQDHLARWLTQSNTTLSDSSKSINQ